MNRALAGTEPVDFDEPVDDVLYGKPIEVPNIEGMSQDEARRVATQAGFQLQAEPNRAYSTASAPGTVLDQNPSAGYKQLPGSVIYYTIATDSMPSWFSTWPEGWDPEVAPDDWWGSSWPPSSFETNPPAGWPSDEPTEEPSADEDSGDSDGDNGRGNNERERGGDRGRD